MITKTPHPLYLKCQKEHGENSCYMDADWSSMTISDSVLFIATNILQAPAEC